MIHKIWMTYSDCNLDLNSAELTLCFNPYGTHNSKDIASRQVFKIRAHTVIGCLKKYDQQRHQNDIFGHLFEKLFETIFSITSMEKMQNHEKFRFCP